MSCVTHSRMALWDLEVSREMAPVVDEVDADDVTTMDSAGERVGVEEDSVADSCRGAGGAVRM